MSTDSNQDNQMPFNSPDGHSQRKSPWPIKLQVFISRYKPLLVLSPVPCTHQAYPQHPRNTPNIHIRHIPSTPGTHPIYTSGIFTAPQEHTQYTHQAYSQHPRNTPNIHIRHIHSTPGTHPIYTSGIFTAPKENTQYTHQAYSQHPIYTSGIFTAPNIHIRHIHSTPGTHPILVIIILKKKFSA